MPIVQAVLIASVSLAAVLAIRAHYLDAGQRWQAYVFKPLATLLVLALALSMPAPLPEYRWAVVAGLVCSLAGDVFLMLPRDRFVPGLASFLVAHLFYLYAFGIGLRVDTAYSLWLPYAVIGGIVTAVIWRNLKPALRGAVILYTLVITCMAGQAAGRWQALGSAAALAAALGAALFVISDSVLAINRFRAHFRAERAVTLSTYWAAQTLIALSI